jgi:diguanylate cyclase (GGDEF)-like protein
VYQHDYRLVLLAAVICVLASLTAFKIYAHAVSTTGLQRHGWSVLTGVCTGSGIWATHFVAMLAYDPGFPAAYEPVTTVASLIIAVVVTTLGFAIAAGGERWRVVVGGLAIGSGIGAMHYTGMQALVMAATPKWDVTIVVTSLVLGAALSAAALTLFHQAGRKHRALVGAAAFTLAIVSLHFSAMGALTFTPDPTLAVQVVTTGSEMDTDMLAIAVAGVVVLVLLSGLAAMLINSQSSRQRENELRTQNVRFDAALNNMGQGLSMFDADQQLVVCNRRYAEMYGLPPELVSPGTKLRDILAYRVASGLYASEGIEMHVAKRLAIVDACLPHSSTIELSDGRTIAIVHQPMEDGGAVSTHEDITERRRNEERILHMAHHDGLTNLPNRTLLRQRLENALARARAGEGVAVLCLDLDRFKDANDALGHSIGDAVLKAVAERVTSLIREADTAARVGGDEFTVVVTAVRSADEVSALAARMINRLSEPLVFEGHQVTIGTSIGIAVAPHDGSDADHLLRHADLALYRAKAEGRGTYRFFEAEMNARMTKRRELEHDLRKAVSNGELELFYQPIMNLEHNEVASFEALLRWRSPTRGLVSPADFIPVAEETGLIVPIGEWAVHEACKEAARWPSHLRVAVNLSPLQFKSPGLYQTIAQALASSGLGPSRLELEITESVLIHDNDLARATLDQIRELGVRIALDDFGTGYSSLSYLRSFPFDKIKIDRSFIHDLAQGSAESLAIVRAVSQLAGTLGMSTTAEGVETAEQLAILRAEGCVEIQGYLLSRPKAASEITEHFGSGLALPESQVQAAA